MSFIQKLACQLLSRREVELNQSTQITVLEAYSAMCKYLERVYDLTGADEIGGLLGSMSLLPDGQTADPGAWFDWVRAIEAVRAGEQTGDLSLEP